jgi:hypothetical protein
LKAEMNNQVCRALPGGAKTGVSLTRLARLLPLRAKRKET